MSRKRSDMGEDCSEEDSIKSHRKKVENIEMMMNMTG